MEKILFNNEIINREIAVDIEDRGYQFGDGIYEVIGVYQSKPFLMDEHLQRLQRSAKEINLNLPFYSDDLKGKLIKLQEENNIVEGLIYLQVSRGVAPRTHELPSDPVTPVVVAYTKPLGDLTKLQESGNNAILEEDIRWLRCDIKTLNLLPNTMAKQKAVEHDAVEAILHRENIVTEASASNVFIVKNNVLYTHPANNYILNGITRQKLIEIAKKLSIPVQEESFTVDELLHADEVFITATKLDVVPITLVDNKTIGSGSPGKTSQILLESLRQITKIL